MMNDRAHAQATVHTPPHTHPRTSTSARTSTHTLPRTFVQAGDFPFMAMPKYQKQRTLFLTCLSRILFASVEGMSFRCERAPFYPLLFACVCTPSTRPYPLQCPLPGLSSHSEHAPLPVAHTHMPTVICAQGVLRTTALRTS